MCFGFLKIHDQICFALYQYTSTHFTMSTVTNVAHNFYGQNAVFDKYHVDMV